MQVSTMTRSLAGAIIEFKLFEGLPVVLHFNLI
jgi:hypothetical protein